MTIEEIATELESWCRGKLTHHDWCGCQIARKLRDALAANNRHAAAAYPCTCYQAVVSSSPHLCARCGGRLPDGR